MEKRGSHTRLALILAAAAIALAATPALAAGSSGEQTIPTFDRALQEASGPLVSLVVGFLVSLLVDVWPEYENWSTGRKRWVYGGLCLVVPLGAACLRGVLGYAAWSFDPLLWHALWNGAGAALAGTVVHMRKKATFQARS